MQYYPRRPVKSFQDLEVYQKLLAVAVAVVKRTPAVPLPVNSNAPADNCLTEITANLHRCMLDLPVLIASAHSRRFGEQREAIEKLDEAMLKCNLAVVYLELYRDLVCPATEAENNIGSEFFEENIKTLLSVRMKLLHLQNSWKKFSLARGDLARAL